MKVHIDPDVCVGHGRCYALAPDVFGADDHGHAVVLVERPEGEQADRARAAAANCPERAVVIEDDA